MGSESFFDIVSEVNLQEVDNAINQAVKELQTRFDFKGSKSSIEFDRNSKKVTLIADDDLKLKNLKDILETKLAKRAVSLKAIKYLPPEKAFDGTIREQADVLQGIAQENAKEIVKTIKDLKLKVQASIQGEKIRVSGKNKDDLQYVIQVVKSRHLSIALQFVNFRSS